MTLDLKVNKDKVRADEGIVYVDGAPHDAKTAKWIQKAKTIHGDKYDYTDTVYTAAKEKLRYRCPIHGEIEQRAAAHTNEKKGCKQCARADYTLEYFKARAIEVHGDTYDYDKVKEDLKSSDPVEIICKEHGEFTQIANNHLRGHGCQICANQATSKTRGKSTETFIEEARKLHGHKYGYDDVSYEKRTTKVPIKCGIHGIFYQSPARHLAGQGCPKCGTQKMMENPNWKAVMSSWSYSDWEKAGNASPNFEGFSLYIIKCTGNGEEFIKIGKTYVGTAKRFSNASAMPYKYKVVTQVYHNAYAISKLEEKIKRALKEYKYNPKRDFGGKEECLTMEALDKAIEMAEK